MNDSSENALYEAHDKHTFCGKGQKHKLLNSLERKVLL